jgi:hypothetical protein
MQLKTAKSQKETGMVTKTMVFCLDARVELTQEEQDAIKKYKLGKEVLYNSEAAQQHLDRGASGLVQGTIGGAMKAFAGLALAKMSLQVTIDSLSKGQHIECKDMLELVGAEDTIKLACQNMKKFLEIAKTFDGKEMVSDF